MKDFNWKNTPLLSVILTLSAAMRKDLCIFSIPLCCLFMNFMNISNLDLGQKVFMRLPCVSGQDSGACERCLHIIFCFADWPKHWRQQPLTINLQIIQRDWSRVPARIAAGSRIFKFKHYTVIRIQSNQQCLGTLVGYRIVDQDGFIRG